MALDRDMSRASITLDIVDAEPGLFEVLRYSGTEGLCQLYRYEIEAKSAGDVDLDALVVKGAVLTVETDFGTLHYHGIIGRIEYTGMMAGDALYRIEIVPALWLLTHRYRSRIFQGKTLLEIIETVVTDSGIAADRITKLFESPGMYVAIDYCVQYRETDYSFICRLMEEAGIWWCFSHEDKGDVLVIGDNTTNADEIEGDSSAIPFVPPSGLVSNQEHVSRFRIGHTVQPGSVILEEFDYENPAVKLRTQGENRRDPYLKFIDYPGEYTTQNAGSAIATIRAEEFESGRIHAAGISNSPRLRPGKKFELTDHPVSRFNVNYLIKSVTVQGQQQGTGTSSGNVGRGRVLSGPLHDAIQLAQNHESAAVRGLADALLGIIGRIQRGDPLARRTVTSWVYQAGQVSRDLANIAGGSGINPLEALTQPNLLDDIDRSELIDNDIVTHTCIFECAPADVIYRPPRVTPWPTMRGPQTARVVGPSGEELYTDELGRIKVQFNWDVEGQADEASSCFIRVSQGWAGGGYGMMFLPRIGQEVIVDFLEGNPDQPIITGRVYNGEHKPAYTLPDEMTKSYIKSNSSKGGQGSNEIRFEDLKDSEQLLIHAQKDLHVRAKNEARITVEKDKHEVIKGDSMSKVTGQLSLKVDGEQAIEIGGKNSLKIKGDCFHDFGGAHHLKVAQGTLIEGDMITLKASSGISLEVGGNKIVIDSTGVNIKGSLVQINSAPGVLVNVVTPMLSSPAAPEEADEVEAGEDTPMEPGEACPICGAPLVVATVTLPDGSEESEVVCSNEECVGPGGDEHWISIELKDEEGVPQSGEVYEITEPDGTVHRGTLDVNGCAKVWVDDPGNCEISFPRLDESEWETGSGGGG